MPGVKAHARVYVYRLAMAIVRVVVLADAVVALQLVAQVVRAHVAEAVVANVLLDAQEHVQ